TQARLPGIAQPIVFMAAEDRGPIDRDIRTFATTIAVALVLLGAGLIAAIFLQVRFGLRPLFALREEVSGLRTGARERIEGRYPAELEPLAGELNALMSHNREVVERQRTHVGNLAHALKTPLSVILAEADQNPGPLAAVVKPQAELMRRQVDHHLRRARAAARARGSGERTSVGPVLDELGRTLERIHLDKAMRIEVFAAADLCFLGERQDLLEIVGNVMENACQWCSKHVRATARADSARRLAVIIEDDGPGLRPEERAGVLERGARLDESAPGSGLGLAIVAELVRAYRGSLILGASPLSGLQVEIRLPRAYG
ncbi:MAG: ATP-binding protein, partial [Caulobacteraceae bacterium]